MIVVIRHLSKAFYNKTFDPGHDMRLDPPIIDDPEEAKKLYHSLIKPPSIVWVSPYLRARQTAEVLNSIHLNETGEQLKIEVTNEIGEYLGDIKPIQPKDFARETLHYSPILDTSIDSLNSRIQSFVSKLRKIPDDKVVWVITHGRIADEIIKYFSVANMSLGFGQSVVLELI